MLFTIKDETATEEGLHSVQKFDEFLDLESCDNRGRGRSGRSTAMGKGPAGQQGTGASFVEQVPINLAHCAFVASGGRWGKAADHPVEDVDATIKPWATNPSAGAIDKNPGLAVIQRANHNIGPTEITETELSQDIALNVRDLNSRINFPRSLSGARSFRLTLVRLAKKDRAAKIAQLDMIHVRDHHMANAEKGEIFDNFIAQSARANNQDARLSHNGLIPPFDRL